MAQGKRSALRAILVSAALLAACGTAAAANYRYDIKKGQQTKLGMIQTYNVATCYSGPIPTYKIVQPAHGKPSLRKISAPFEKTRCKGKIGHGLEMSYRPDPGFTGRDRGKVTFYYPMHVETSQKRASAHNFVFDVK